MKRWNQKGTIHAHRRMGELRERKLRITKSLLIDEWNRVTGRAHDSREWWTVAQGAGLVSGCGIKVVIEFLRDAIEQAKITP